MKNFTNEQLTDELEKRAAIKAKEEKPEQVPVFDPAPLRKICQDYIDAISSDGYAGP